MSAELSASAKKRAAKKARDAAAAGDAPPGVAQAKATPNTAAATAEPKAKAAELSASAKKRAAKKARDAAAAGEAPPAVAQAKATPNTAATAEPKAKAKAKAAAPAAKSAAKAELKKTAEKAEPKNAAEKPKAEPKSTAKAAAKAKSKPEPREYEEEPVRKGPEVLSYSFDDDGQGGDWEKASGLTKKATKQKETKSQREAEVKAMGFANTQQAVKQLQRAQNIPGFSPVEAIGGKPGVSQGTAAGPALIAKIQAEAALKAQAAAAGGAVEEEKVNTNTATVQIPCPPEKIGRIIGPGGATLKMITEKCGVDRIDTQDGMVTIIGDAEGVKKAEVACKEMIEKGFMSLAYDNFNEAAVMVHPVHFPSIIGPKGAIIMALKKELKVEVNIPPGIQKDSKGSWGKKKHPISIAGSTEAVEKAKEVLNDIVYYGHHPITHEGVIHEELEIEEWTYRFIIGPKGSEMRHIQNSFKVAVNIPRDNCHDTGSNPNLLIVGQADDVKRAKKHIEKVIYNAEHNPGGQGREDKAMGDERDNNDEIDAVAAQYLYKRR